MGKKKFIVRVSVIIIIALLGVLFLQSMWAHRGSYSITDDIECSPLLGWFTREDRLVSGDNGLASVNIEPGDILVTVSTHSAGWRHGHAALVVNDNLTLESCVLGKDSSYCRIKNWETYSTVAVLRVKDSNEDICEQVLDYSGDNLFEIPYRLLSGFIGDKARDSEAHGFGVQCAYLPWYAWKEFGYDLDSDGGRVVTPADLMDSEHVEIIYSYGMEK